MANDQYLLKHYRNIAHQFGASPRSSIRDQVIRETELDFILSEIFDFVAHRETFPSVLDLGCGNGYTLSVLRDLFPEMALAGLEFSPELAKIAQKRNLSHCLIIEGDMRVSLPFEKIDMVLTQRSLINLLSRSQQLQALENIYALLPPNGLYLMVESFNTSLNELNLLLQENNFDPIVPSKHNLFVKEGLLKYMNDMGFKEIDSQLPSNQLSTYFVLTRLLHPMIRSKGEKRLNNRLIKFFIEGLDQAAGHFSPLQFRVFRKI